MSQTSYETVEPLIAQASQQGLSMRVTFRCPVSGHTVDARGALQASGVASSRAAQSAKRSLLASMRSSITGVLRRSLGYGVTGQVATDAARGAMRDESSASAPSYSDADRKAAVLRAFESVAGEFVWDEESGRYIAAQAAPRS